MKTQGTTTIRTRILSVVLLPLLLLVVMGLVSVRDSLSTRRLAHQMQINARCFQAASDFITELQRERGRTSMFLTGKLSRAELEEQRQKTDIRQTAFGVALQASALGPDVIARSAPVALKLAELRQQVGTSVTAPAEAIRLYSEKVEQLMALMGSIANSPTTGGVGKGFTSLLLVETAKEGAGVLRATLSGVLGEDQPVSQERLARLLNLKGSVTASLSSKALALSGKGQASLVGLPKQPHWQEVDRVMTLVVAKAQAGSFGVDPTAFWGQITQVIDDLGALVTAENALLLERTATIEREAGRSVIRLGLGFAVVLCLTVAFSLVMAHRISRPIRRTVDMLKDISSGEGDLTKRLPVTSRDEIGELSEHFNQFVARIQGIIEQMAGNAHTVATSATELSAVSTQTTQSVLMLSEKTATVAAAAEEASANTMSVAASMEQASTNLGSVASATEEMSATIGEIAANSEKARAISAGAGAQAAAVSSLMEGLGRAAQEIGKVTETITEISSQTNLLALNATIEAARAGAAGKGFAVVANEIKELAKQTAAATEDIKTQIGGVQTATGSAIADIQKITGVIAEVGELVTSIATAIEEQAVVTKDVAGNIAQASAGVKEANERVAQTATVSRSIAQDVASVNAAAGDIRSGGEQVQGSARQLSTLADQLTVIVGQFKTRAAATGGNGTGGSGSREFMPWKEEYSVSVTSMDAHHRKLIGLINRLHASLKAGEAASATKAVLKELVSYTQYHFKAEEELLARIQYADLPQHQQIHRQFLAVVDGACKRWDDGDASVPQELLQLLEKWLIQHIQGVDKPYGICFARFMAGAKDPTCPLKQGRGTEHARRITQVAQR